MSTATHGFMRRLYLLRSMSSPMTSTVQRRRANDVGIVGNFLQQRNKHELTTIPVKTHSISAESDSAVGKHESLRKREYQIAPKRQHGRHAGWRKWSISKQSVGKEHSPVVQGTEGESLPSRKELREVSTKLNGIRVSPWNLNLLTRVVRGLPVIDAIAQMEFCKKKHSVTVQRLIKNACNLADIRYGMIPEQLKVAEVFVTKGQMQKRIRIMGRGRVGIGHVKWSHINLTLREIDFDELIRTAPTKTRMRKLEARKGQVAALVQAAEEQ